MKFVELKMKQIVKFAMSFDAVKNKNDDAIHFDSFIVVKRRQQILKKYLMSFILKIFVIDASSMSSSVWATGGSAIYPLRDR